MKTLIELFDERAIENVLATEVFRPKETILLCPPEVESSQVLKNSLKEYFRVRNCPVKLTVVPVSMLDAVKVEKRLREILETHEDCAIDISGGTDAALFAAGSVSADGSVAVFTYSRKRNTFFEIKNAPFARSLPCDIRLDARSCFLMAGGTLLPGREDNAQLKGRIPQIDRLFGVYRSFRKIWRTQIGYIQQISSAEAGMLLAHGPRSLKVEKHTANAEPAFLRALEKEGLIGELSITENEVAFRFPDETVRFWLRDIGSVLELLVYRSCIAAGCFDDVILSAVVNWDGGTSQRNAVTNEIDVMAVRGVQPLLISCKTSEIKTEALNELAILRDRFGGKGSRAMIVTSAPVSKSRAIMRMRAAKLGIEVVEWDDLVKDRLVSYLQAEMK